MENKRDCPRHGYLARKCPLCEAEQDERNLEVALTALREIAELPVGKYCDGNQRSACCYAALAKAALEKVEGK